MLTWLTNQPAYLFLLADDERLAKLPPQRLGRTWVGLLVMGFLWGLGSIGLWHGGLWLFGQPMGMYLLPSLAVVMGMLLWPYRRAAISLIRLLGGAGGTGKSLLAALLCLLLLVCFLVLRPSWHLGEQALPLWLAWIRPESKLDRLLLLLPLWGAWSMFILPQFHRPAESDITLLAIMRGCGPLTCAAIMGALLAASIGYFAYLPWTQLTIPAAAVLAGIGGGLLLARRNGALDRNVLLATNLLTQLALLLAVVANSNLRGW